ncbi:cation:proton antiporter [Rhodospirillaceae bacterium SYSU D60014]|uniref:cation:proton antiporter n=1 Tax=Virgifigura deserti TaxID=2268457 RepID=UPI0013C3E8D9
MEEHLLLLIVLVSTAGIAAQWIAWRFSLPAIVILLAAGFLLGPLTRILSPEQNFGALLDPAIGLAVAIIVLEESLGLNFAELRASGRGIARIVGLGVPLIAAMGTAAAHFIAGLSWPIAALVGVMLVITGPTVITPLLRQAKLAHRTDSLLRWESVVNEPIGAVLTVIVLEFLVLWDAARQIEAPLTDVALSLVTGTLAAAAFGFGTAFAMRFMFYRGHVPEFLKSPLVLAVALLIYALSDVVQSEAGLIAVAVLGVALANFNLPEIEDLRRFKAALSTFLVSGVFIVLTANLDIETFLHLDWRAFAFIGAALLVVRPLAIGIATISSGLTWQERLFLGLIAPRGIVVAALAGFAGTRLAGSGYDGAEMVAPLVFSIIIVTVVLHGLIMGPLSRFLGLASERPPGLLIVGASDWTVALTKALTRLGTPVVLSDRSGAALRPAEGIAVTTHTGHLLAMEEEEEELLLETEFLLAATEDDAFNALVCQKFAPEFGQQNVHQLAYADRSETAQRFHREWRGKIIIAREATLAELNRRLSEGWRFELKPVRDEDTREALDPSPDSSIPVVLVKTGGGLLFASPESEFSPDVQGTLVVFQAPAAAEKAGAKHHQPRAGR